MDISIGVFVEVFDVFAVIGIVGVVAEVVDVVGDFGRIIPGRQPDAEQRAMFVFAGDQAAFPRLPASAS